MATGLANIVVMIDGTVRILQYRYGTYAGFTSDFEFLPSMLASDTFIEEFFSWQPYPEALAQQGPLAFDECFGYVPLLALGLVSRRDHSDFNVDCSWGHGFRILEISSSSTSRQVR